MSSFLIRRGFSLRTSGISSLRAVTPVSRSFHFSPVSRRSQSAAEERFLASLPTTNVTTLPNGLRVATEETPGSPTATVGVWLDAGSAYESEENNGVAHFLEHMSFKGTKNRRRQDIEVEIENMGATLNAYTSREQTVYYAQCLANDVEKCTDILADILQNSQIATENIESERGVILQEKEHVEAVAEEVVFDYLHAAAYQGTPLGRTILGPNRNIKSISRDQLVKYVESHHLPHRMVLVGAGGISHETLVKIAEAKFGALPAAAAGSALLHEQSREVPPFTGSEVRVRDDTMPEAHVAIGYEGVGWSNADYFTFKVIQAIVGEWSHTQSVGVNASSHLAELMATEERALSFQTFNTSYQDTGLFGIYLVAKHETLDDAMCYALSEFVRISRNATETEIERAKRHVKSNLLIGLDGSSPTAEEIGRQMISLGRRISPAEMCLRVDSITAADVKRVATHYLTDTDVAIAAIGPLGNLPDYNILRGWTYWNRV